MLIAAQCSAIPRQDITGFIFPFGYIHSVDKRGTDVLVEIQEFHASANKLKTLEMHKEVHGFNFGHLRRMVYGYIRALGWWRGLSISFPRANYRVKIWTSNWLSNCWESCLGKCLCYLSIVGCIMMKMYRDKSDDIVSVYQIQYHPVQVFEMIKPMIWCPGFSGRRMACELMRNIMW